MKRLNTLKQFFKDHTIPEIKEPPKTFQAIAGQPHYENVVSNIYAFFFNPDEEHQLRDLFINSLFVLLKKYSHDKTLPFEYMEGFKIDTEYSTSKGRIDLLFHNEAEAIIIENKIYHHLKGNPLKDYWHSQKKKKRIALVLSLNPIVNITSYHKNFISITHLELLSTIMSNIGTYLLDANEKYVTFLKDFYQNIINLSTYKMNNEEIKFYYDHLKQINETEKFKSAFRNHIITQVEGACYELDLELYRSRGNIKQRQRYFQSKINSNLMFTINFKKLLENEMELGIHIELKHQLLNNKIQFDTLAITDREKEIINKNFLANTHKVWAYFASKIYLLNEEDISQIQTFIFDKISEDGFLSLFAKIENKL